MSTLFPRRFDLILISKTADKLKKIKANINDLFPNVNVFVHSCDMLNSDEILEFVNGLDKSRKYFFVHCAGLNTGAYTIANDNPYLPIDELSFDLPVMEFETVVKSLHIMVKNLLPLFRKQDLTKVIVVNSMSGLRAYPLGFSHSSAKAGMHNATRALTLELNKANIFVSEVNPGIVDTGIYDNEIVQNAVKKISLEFGYKYEVLPMMSPHEVGKAIFSCLISEAHILEINMVAKGQWPHVSA